MAIKNISALFGSASSAASKGDWVRPVHETANQCFVLPGASCCICVPTTATRVVVEMWGQGGGGAGACCCMYAANGGQGGSYAYKVWSTAAGNAPSSIGNCFMFCGCVCSCDCKSYDQCGSAGQFSRLTMCSSPSWIGCVNGGQAGCSYCTAGTWYCCQGCQCNTQYDMCAFLGLTPGATTSTASQTTFIGSNAGGAVEMGPSCLCGGAYVCVPSSASSTINFTPTLAGSSGGSTATIDQIFVPVGCGCFDAYRQGACGFRYSACAYNGSSASGYRIGIGGAAYAGGRQQECTCNAGQDTFCGMGGNFPGGGGRSSSACGGGCCLGSYGGGGLILVSWKT